MSGFDWLHGATGIEDDARNALQQNEEAMRAFAKAQKERARLFYDVFATGRGPELLELLRNQTIEVDLMQLQGVIGGEAREFGVNPSEWAYHRNGQNSVVRYIENMVRLASQPEAEESNDV